MVSIVVSVQDLRYLTKSNNRRLYLAPESEHLRTAVLHILFSVLCISLRFTTNLLDVSSIE